MSSTKIPKVSVVIPTHDRPELVVSSVRSVLLQTYRDIELIVVDVGLKKRSKVALAEFFADPRFRYVEHPTELPGGAARNIGAKLAMGEYVAFQDDDDEWISEKLEIQMSALRSASSQVGFCFSAVINDYGEGKEIISQVDAGERDFSELAYRRMKGFLTVTLVIKKEVFDAVGGFDETLPSHQDPELILRIAQKWNGLAIDKPLVRVNMCQDHESVGKSYSRRILGREMVLEKHSSAFQARPQALAYHYFQIGLWYRDSGELAKARFYFQKAFALSGSSRHALHALYATVLVLRARILA